MNAVTAKPTAKTASSTMLNFHISFMRFLPALRRSSARSSLAVAAERPPELRLRLLGRLRRLDLRRLDLARGFRRREHDLPLRIRLELCHDRSAEVGVGESRLQPPDERASVWAVEPGLGLRIADWPVDGQLHTCDLIMRRAAGQWVPEVSRQRTDEFLGCCARGRKRSIGGAQREFATLQVVRGAVRSTLARLQHLAAPCFHENLERVVLRVYDRQRRSTGRTRETRSTRSAKSSSSRNTASSPSERQRVGY